MIYKKKKLLVLLGPAGSFSHLAAKKLRGTWKLKFVDNFQELFRAIEKGAYGLCPLRNKMLGEVPGVAIFFKKNKLKIIKKFHLRVSLVLAAKARIPFTGIRTVYVSKIAQRQCIQFLRRNFSRQGGRNFAAHSVSTSASFKKIVQLKGIKSLHSSAIGSEFGAKMYGLKILANDIQDEKNNWTEFWLISKNFRKNSNNSYEKKKNAHTIHDFFIFPKF